MENTNVENKEQVSEMENTQFYEVVKHDKLLPFLNAKAEYHKSRLQTLNDKRNTQIAKLKKNKAKIEKLATKADKLEDMNKMLNILVENIPSVKSFIERNEKKIKDIRERKIPSREEKIKFHKTRISEIDKKSEKIGHKLERNIALSDTVKSFTILNNEKRKKNFAEAMDRLNKSTCACISDKYRALSDVIAENPEKSEKLNPKLEKLGQKFNKFSLLSPTYSRLNDEQINKAMKNTADVINKDIENGSGISKLSENIVERNSEDKVLHNVDELHKLNEKYPFLAQISTMIASLENEINGLKQSVNTQKQSENSAHEFTIRSSKDPRGSNVYFGYKDNKQYTNAEDTILDLFEHNKEFAKLNVIADSAKKGYIDTNDFAEANMHIMSNEDKQQHIYGFEIQQGNYYNIRNDPEMYREYKFDKALYEKLIQERSELKKTSEFIDSAISESKVSDNQYKLNKALSKVSEKYSDEEISAALSSDYCKSHPKLIEKFSEKLSERKQANEQVMVLEDECTRGR